MAARAASAKRWVNVSGIAASGSGLLLIHYPPSVKFTLQNDI
jgi:hypothetical protein